MKIGGQILWNATPICETSQIYYLMGRRPMKDVLGNHLKDRSSHLVHGSLVECHPITAKDPVPNPSIWKESFTRIVLCARWIWEGDVLVADLETVDTSEIYSEKLNAKEVILPKENGKFILQPQMGESNFPEEIRNFEHPP